jgi:hypothetical protein
MHGGVGSHDPQSTSGQALQTRLTRSRLRSQACSRQVWPARLVGDVNQSGPYIAGDEDFSRPSNGHMRQTPAWFDEGNWVGLREERCPRPSKNKLGNICKVWLYSNTYYSYIVLFDFYINFNYLSYLKNWSYKKSNIIFDEFYYSVSNQCELFICLDLIIKNREVYIERYFKWWIGTKLMWARY